MVEPLNIKMINFFEPVNCAMSSCIFLLYFVFPGFSVTQTRLMGNVAGEGRLEVLLNGTWSTMCSDHFNDHSGVAMCSSLNYTG